MCALFIASNVLKHVLQTGSTSLWFKHVSYLCTTAFLMRWGMNGFEVLLRITFNTDLTNQTNRPPFSGLWNFQHEQGSRLSSERSGTPKKRKAPPPPPVSPIQVMKKSNLNLLLCVYNGGGGERSVLSGVHLVKFALCLFLCAHLLYVPWVNPHKSWNRVAYCKPILVPLCGSLLGNMIGS